MAAATDNAPKWKELGRSTTSPRENKVRKEVKLDEYYVVVGFEVDHPDAFVNETHDLGIDYGHAFFYIVKNNIVTKLFSFGPKNSGKVGWFGAGDPIVPNKYNIGAVIKDGAKDSRPGDPDYEINDKIKVFKIPVLLSQGIKLETETDKARQKIISGKQKYTAFLNDTCAETARDILSDAGIDTPGGSGKLKHSKVASFPLAYAVNPYMWHHKFKKSKYKEVSYTPDVFPFRIPLGNKDPIFKAGE